MNAERLLNEFRRIADAPDTVAHLRRFILDLAVRGKLLDHDPSDEPATGLVNRIQVEKACLAKVSGKKDKAVPEGPDNEDQFEIPSLWTWSRLSEIGFINPRNAAADDELVGFVPMTLVSAEYGTPAKWEVRTWGEVKSGFTHFADGDVALAKITPCFQNRKSTVFRGLPGGIGAGTTELHVVRPLFVLPDYVLIYLKSPFFVENGIPRMTGTAGQKRVPTDYFTLSPLPLPPIAEQRRIVAKVDELMALCDQLEAAQARRESRRDRLVSASLHRLNQPADDATNFRDHARFALDHLARFTTQPEHIPQLRQTILNLAVRGKLVPQNPKDEPASELLNRLQVTRAALFNEGVFPRPKLMIHDEAALEAKRLDGWTEAKFGDVCNLVTSGSRGWGEYYSDKGPKFIRAQNIRFGRLRLEDLALVNPPQSTERNRTKIASGDLFVVITGAGVTNPAMLDHDLGDAYVSQHVALIKPTSVELSRWLLLCLMAPAAGRRTLLERAYGAGKPGLNLDNIRSLPIPLPPLTEQHRIVAKVDDLMALCDRLESQLTATQTDSRRLLEAVLHEAVAPANVESDSATRH